MAKVDLKYEPKDGDVCCGPEGPYYPHSFWFRDDETKKLGLEKAKVGETMTIPVTFKVTSVSLADSENSGPRYSVTLTAIEAEMPDKKSEKTPLETRLYTKG